jgi:hypothetical protein
MNISLTKCMHCNLYDLGPTLEASESIQQVANGRRKEINFSQFLVCAGETRDYQQRIPVTIKDCTQLL